jgi:hypothetical protein
MINFDLRLADTYWSKGFFNVSVDFERYLTKTEGPIEIFLGADTEPLIGRISRSANLNATPRIYGHRALADFFQKRFKRGSFVSVEVISLNAIRIGGGAYRPQAAIKPVAMPLKHPARSLDALVSADKLATWRRALIGILNELEPKAHRGPDEGVAKRIHRLSHDGLIPREVAAMMRVVTEMRNVTEYQSKVLSGSESAAVTSAWAAIRHWADTREPKS